MNKDELYTQLKEEAKNVTFWQQHRFLMLIGGAILISLAMVSIALYVYYSSGAFQLDLSRPGYQSVRDEIDYSSRDDSFSTSGPLDKEAFEEFRGLYKEQTEDARKTNGFSPEALSDQALGLDSVFNPTL